jgi:hypothetical protein
VAYTSPDDAFPGDVPRPLQPNLNVRSFAITPTLATHVQLRVLSTQCTGQAKFAGDQDDDPFNNSDCPSSASGGIARATEFEVFTSTPTTAPIVVSRKSHTGVGTFDVNLPLSGTVGIECRAGQPNTGNHTIVATFPTPISSVASATCAGNPATTSISGNSVTVNCTGVPNAQTIAINLMGVNGAINFGDVSIPMGVLLGDIDATKSVSGSDVNRCKAQVGAPLTQTNFRNDVDLTGSVSGSDVNKVKAQVGSFLP